MRAMIFDVDGTLLQSAAEDESIYRDAVTAVLGPVQFRNDLHDYRHVTDSGIFRQVLQDNEIERWPGLETTVRDVFLDMAQQHIRRNGPFQAVPGAKKLLRRLEISSEHSVAIATGGWRSVAEFKLRTSGFDVESVPMATSDDSHDRIEIMKIARSHLFGNFDDVTYFGDAPWDQAACQTLGWDFVGVGSIVDGINDFNVFRLNRSAANS